MFKALFARLRKRKATAGSGVGPASSIKIQSTDINDVLDENGDLR